MITFVIIMAAIALLSPIIGLLGALVSGFHLEWGWADTFFDYMQVVFYLVPVYDLWPLMALIFTLALIRIVIAVLKFLFDAIPLY